MSVLNINRGNAPTNPVYMQLAAGIIQPVRTVTANDTATVNDYLILADATSGAITETLPAGLSSLQTCVLVIKKKDSSANAVTVSAGSSTIDGQGSLSLYTQDASVTLQWNGSTWSIEAAVGGLWANWTPTVSGSGSMTVSSLSVTDAQFQQVGSLIYAKCLLSFTLGGTASNQLTVTLPTTAAGATAIFSTQVNPASSPGNWISAVGFVSGNQILVRISSQPNFTLGATGVGAFGFYRSV